MALRTVFNTARNPFIRNAFFNQSLKDFPCAFSGNRRALKINNILKRDFASDSTREFKNKGFWAPYSLESDKRRYNNDLQKAKADWKSTGFFQQLAAQLSKSQKRCFCTIANSKEEKKINFEEFKEINPFEEFQEADIIRDLLGVQCYPTIKHMWYEDFCKIEQIARAIPLL